LRTADGHYGFQSTHNVKRINQGTFQTSFISIGSMVSKKNTFKRFPSHTKKLRHCKGSSNDYSCADGINQKSSF
jgi:hypothetical protein